MQERTGRKRIGWLGGTGAVLLVAGLAFGGLLWWAVETDPAGTLDSFDARFARGRVATLVEKARYGSDPAQKLSLYVPSGEPPPSGFPFVVFFHGGGWHSGDP